MVNLVAPDPYLPCKSMHNFYLDDVDSSIFTKIYCSCGRFIDMDTKTLNLKQNLHKPIECIHCRNLRISKELDLLDEEYTIVEELVLG